MMRNKIEQMWEASPSGIKRALGIAAGIVGFVAGITSEEEKSSQVNSISGHYNYRVGKLDDGEDVYGIYDECDRLPSVPYAEDEGDA